MRLLATAIVALVLTGSAGAHRIDGTWQEIHHGATALLWLANHPQALTPQVRAREFSQHHALLFRGLRDAGWLTGALCVHRHEGSWADPDSPYYGGMQMDHTFQRSHGPQFLDKWGTADRWPIWAQMYVSYVGWLDQGWSAWPNTARYCGLL